MNRFFKLKINVKVILIALFISISVYGKEKKWQTQITGNQIQVGGQLAISDPETDFLFTSVKHGFVELKIDNFNGPYYWYECKVTTKITPILENQQEGDAFEHVFTVENNRYLNFGNFIDLEKKIVEVSNIIGVKIEILEVYVFNKETQNQESIIPANVSLTVGYEIERYYNIENIVLDPTANYINADNTIAIQWDGSSNSLVESYELEWTWVDNYGDSPGNTTAPSSILFSNRDFELNHTRITTKDNTYKIPQIYNKGWLLYRVRPIGKKYDANGILFDFKREWTNYSFVQNVADWSSKFEIIEEHQNKLNWQFQASYAEDGKKKEVVSYFDGSLRNRQTVTKINSNNKAIIGEVIYDAEGKSAVEILPTPTNNPSINFYPNFNKNQNGKTYSYLDLLVTGSNSCLFPAIGMSEDSGASKYYSANNPIENNFQDFVPDAEKFPFSQIIYTPDNTGRIKMKGGVGKTHQIGTNHEMKYFYSIPTQEELNRIFGTSVGYASHYKKNIVVDPNGQVSTSYIDPKGKTIATALSDKNPDSMEPISNNTAQNITVDLLNKATINAVDTTLDNNEIYLQSAFSPTGFDGLQYNAQRVLTGNNNVYSFNYKLTKTLPFSINCNTKTFKYPFIYNLKLTAIDDCGVQGGNFDSQIKTIGSYQLASDNTVVESSSSALTAEYNYQISINSPKNYGLTKKLFVDLDALDIFANDYIKKAVAEGCIASMPVPNPNDNYCYYTCEQCASYYDGVPYTLRIQGKPDQIIQGLAFTSTIQSINQKVNELYPASANNAGRIAYIKKMLEADFDLSNLYIPNVEQSNEYYALLTLLADKYAQEWTALRTACDEACNSGSGAATTSLECQNILEEIQDDLLPSGQYGFKNNILPDNANDFDSNEMNNTMDEVNIENLSDTDLVNYPVSVYNIDNSLRPLVDGVNPQEADWKHPSYYNLPNTTNAITDLNHYYTTNGQIARITVTFSEGIFTPELDTNINSINNNLLQPVPGEENMFTIEPQYLRNFRDFCTYINANKHWTLSLVKYHPEFHYLDYTLQQCRITKDIIVFNTNFKNAATPVANDVTVNSNGFDSFLNSIENWNDAVRAGLFTTPSSNNTISQIELLRLIDNDPFFTETNVKDGLKTILSSGVGTQSSTPWFTTNQARQVKRAIMLQALTRSFTNFNLGIGDNLSQFSNNSDSSSGYEMTTKKMIDVINETLFCSMPGGTTNCPSFSGNTVVTIPNELQNASQSIKDRFVNYYKTYYIGLKQKIQEAFIQLHAYNHDAFNECIGNNGQQNPNHIVTVIDEYAKPAEAITSFIHAPNNIPSTNLFNNCSGALASKIKRYVSSFDLYNSELSTNQIATQLASQVNSQFYAQTGICPNVRDLSLFLDNAFQSKELREHHLFNSSTTVNSPANQINYLSHALLQAMGGSYNNTLSVTSSISSSNNLQLTFNQQGLTLTNNTLSLTNTSSLYPWSTCGTSWTLAGVKNLAYTGYNSSSGEYAFTLTAKIYAANPNNIGSNPNLESIYNEIVLTGKTKIVLTCGSINNPNNADPNAIVLDEANCDKKEKFGIAIKELINNIKTFATANNLTNSNNEFTIPQSIVPPMIKQYFNITNTNLLKWVNESSNTYKFLINNNRGLHLTLNFNIYNTLLNSVFIGENTNLSNNPTTQLLGSYNAINSLANQSILASCYTFNILNPSPKIPIQRSALYLRCCTDCGEWDYDLDGIGDNGNFGESSCDNCNQNADIDNDGVSDCIDECDNSNDFDCDGILNAVDTYPYCDNRMDGDGDGIPFNCDNCKSVHNVSQIDTDGDGFGDACDECKNLPSSTNFGCPTNQNYCNDYYNELNTFISSIKTLYNQAITFANSGNNITITNPYFMNSFISDQNIISRFQNLISIQYNHNVQINHSEILLTDAKMPYQINFYKNYNNGTYDAIYVIRLGHFYTSTSSVFTGPVTSINNLNLGYSNYFGLPIISINFDTTNQLNKQLEFTDDYPKIYYQISGFERSAGSLCQFVSNQQIPLQSNEVTTSNVNKIAKESKEKTENLAGITSKYNCNCIPPVPTPVSCTDAYIQYATKMKMLKGLASSSPDENATTPYTKMSFCNYNLAFITEGYLNYLSQFNITSISDPRYITIGEFGATPLNFGFNNYSAVITGYKLYLDNIQNSPIYFDPGTNLDKVETWQDYATYYLLQNPSICPPAPMTPLKMPPVDDPENSCSISINAIASVYNAAAYEVYLANKKNEFKKAYIKDALENVIENYTMTYSDNEYQYTLYYYDQAGNLIQTVPPKGVNRIAETNNLAINSSRIAGLDGLVPAHTLNTQYKYNSLNQLVWQNTPDGGTTKFAYDDLGRIIASQNAKQFASATVTNPIYILGTNLQFMAPNTIIANKGKKDKNNYGFTKSAILSEGVIERTILNTSKSDNTYLGFSYRDNLASAIDDMTKFIDYGIGLYENNKIVILFKNQNGGQERLFLSQTVSINDALKIFRNAGKIYYYKNETLLYTADEYLFSSYRNVIVNFVLDAEFSTKEIANIIVTNTTIQQYFSYTRYDKLGRIKEAGQFATKKDNPLFIDDNGKLKRLATNALVNTDANTSTSTTSYPFNVSSGQQEVTITLYDDYGILQQNVETELLYSPTHNTRNRVTAILTYPNTNELTNYKNYETGIFYNYDIHGNVDQMVQSISPSILQTNTYGYQYTNKRVFYEYDLISGNVNKVIYQKKEPDQFIHKYNYDADNRITSVETSNDGYIWEKDATYYYYEHGPLAKTVIGDKKVQGIDYAYTLQGWLKAVNSENFDSSTNDIGKDGELITKDAFGFSLNYFNEDYKSRFNATDPFKISQTMPANNIPNLYNGNIRQMVTSVRDLNANPLKSQANLYKYDQLNRIFSMQSFTNNAGTFTNSYASNYVYDANGNILKLNRAAPKVVNGVENITAMDSFTYNYTAGTNKLRHVNDIVSASQFATDIDNQNADNYKYDEIGQLIADTAENISKIEWRVDGKVKAVTKLATATSPADQIVFFYDGLGNRVAKKSNNLSKSGGTISTHYTRDAQGNVMGVYDLKNYGKTIDYLLKEHHLYGSSRIGIQNYDGKTLSENAFVRLTGDKSFELSNHLGNVLSVVSDRKTVTKNIKLFYENEFTKEQWESINDAKVYINKESELEVFASQAGQGTRLELNMPNHKTYGLSFKLNREAVNDSIPLLLRISDIEGNVLKTQNLLQSGTIFSNFTTGSVEQIVFEVLINAEITEQVGFTIDDALIYYYESSNTDFASLFIPDVMSYNDYYPFGSLVPNRNASNEKYRYGFQNQEKDDELKGEGNSLNYTFRMHDPRVGRFFAIDPLTKKYPYLSPYQFSSNQPLHASELEGLESSNELGGNYAQDDTELMFSMMFGWVGDARAGVLNLTSRAFGSEDRFAGDGFFGFYKLPKNSPKPSLGSDLFDTTIGLVSARYGIKSGSVFSVKTGVTVASVTLRELRIALASKIGADVKYINFSKAVFTKKLESKVELVQYRLKKGTKGDYYAPKGTTPEEIGLRREDVQQTFSVTIVKPVEDVLVSTHIANKAPYYNPKLPKVKGTGTQYTSTEIKKEGVAIWKEIDNPK